MTAIDVASPLSAQDARALTDRLRTALEVTWELVVAAYEGRAWEALGLGSWDDYCRAEFGSARLRLPREERADTVQSLRDAGMSQRAISSATGLDRKTVAKELAAGQVGENPPPDDARVVGVDGKSYPAQVPSRGDAGPDEIPPSSGPVAPSLAPADAPALDDLVDDDELAEAYSEAVAQLERDAQHHTNQHVRDMARGALRRKDHPEEAARRVGLAKNLANLGKHRTLTDFAAGRLSYDEASAARFAGDGSDREEELSNVRSSTSPATSTGRTPARSTPPTKKRDALGAMQRVALVVADLTDAITSVDPWAAEGAQGIQPDQAEAIRDQLAPLKRWIAEVEQALAPATS